MLKKCLILCALASIQISGQSKTVAIATGYHHCLALREDGKVFAWGLENDNNGKCVADFNELANVKAIAAGGYQSCALKKDNTVVVAGDIGSDNLPSGEDITAIAGAGYADIAILKDSSVVVWGGNMYGVENIPSGLKAIYVAGAFHFFVAVRSDSTVVAWEEDGATAVIPDGLREVVAVAAGRHHVLALQKDGTVVAWGNSGTEAQTAVPSGLVAKAIAASESFSVAVRTDGTVVAWGSEDAITNVPSGLSDIIAVSAGWHHVLALNSNGEIFAWGDNSVGQCDIPGDITAIASKHLCRSDFFLMRNSRMAQAAPRVFELNGRAIADNSAQNGSFLFPTPRLARYESGRAIILFAK